MYYLHLIARLIAIALLNTTISIHAQDCLVYDGIPNTIGGAPDLAVQYYQDLLSESGYLLKDHLIALGKTANGPYQSIADIGYNEKKTAFFSFQLEIDLRFDFSQVKSRQKMKYKFSGMEITYFYQGDVIVSPRISVLIRDTKSNQLIEKIQLDLDEMEVWVENAEGSSWADIKLIMYQENMQGINDVMAERFSDFEEEITFELGVQLSKTKLDELEAIVKEINSNH